MKNSIKARLLRWCYSGVYEWFEARARNEVYEEHKRELCAMSRLANTIDARSPLDESELMSRFVSLEADYRMLEKECSRALLDKMYAERELKILKDQKLGWERPDGFYERPL
jgi:hypothetical protein